MQIPRRRTALILSCGLLASLPALAADEPRYNQVSLRAEVSKEVARDLMVVTLYSEAQNTDPGKLAKQITETMNKAVQQSRQVKDVKISQGSRNSYPVYDSKGQKISGWRERAELRLESANFPALSQLTADLLQELRWVAWTSPSPRPRARPARMHCSRMRWMPSRHARNWLPRRWVARATRWSA